MSYSAATALILAGGFGTRLQGVVADRPKVLATVRGRPFLTYILDQILKSRIRGVVLCTGFGADAIEREFGPAYEQLQLAYSRETSPLGTAGALRNAISRVHSEVVVVLNGDSFCDIDLEEFLSWCDIHQARLAQVLVKVDDTSRFGRVVARDSGEIVKFEEKSHSGDAGWVNAGIYRFEKRVLDDIPSGREISLERDVLPLLVGHGLYGFKTGRQFIDIGTPQSYAAAEEFFATICNAQ